MRIIKKIYFLLVLILIITVVVNASESINETNKTEQDKNEHGSAEKPGFESVFAIAGILAISYLVLRNRE